MDNPMVIFNTIALWIIVAGQIAQLVHLKKLEKENERLQSRNYDLNFQIKVMKAQIDEIDKKLNDYEEESDITYTPTEVSESFKRIGNALRKSFNQVREGK